MISSALWLVLMALSGVLGWIGGGRYQRRGERRGAKASRDPNVAAAWVREHDDRNAKKELAARLRQESAARSVLVEVATVRKAISELELYYTPESRRTATDLRRALESGNQAGRPNGS